MCKNIILFRLAGSNKECLRKVSQMMGVDNCLVYKSKTTENWYVWEHDSAGRPLPLSNAERDTLLNNPNNKIINWGNFMLDDSHNFIANKPSACKNSSNKWVARKLWQSAGIKTPLSSDCFAGMIDFSFVARPHKHARQSEFHHINNLVELAALLAHPTITEWYYQKVVEKTCEFRVYVGGDDVLTIFWKGDGDQLLSSNRVWSWLDTVNWNYNKLPPIFVGGYTLSQFKEDVTKIKVECVRATSVLGLSYSGIDVGLDSINRDFNLFEANTDPELTPLPQQKFAAYFDTLFNS